MIKGSLACAMAVMLLSVPSGLGVSGTSLATTTTTHHVYAGQAWSGALDGAKGGDTVVVHPGLYPRQSITQRYTGPVTIVGENRDGVIVQGLDFTSGATNVVVRNMTVMTAGPYDQHSAIKVYGGAQDIRLDSLWVEPLAHAGIEIHNWAGPAQRVRITNNIITGGSSSTPGTGRNIWIGDLNGGDRTTWPRQIEIVGNDLSRAAADAVHISGGTDVLIARNVIHSLQENDNHNDGVQSVASYNLRIVGNRITSPPPPACDTCVPPDQGIIVGHASPATTYKKVTNTVIVNNIVHHWRGQGIVTAGTRDTFVVNNTVTRVGPSGTRIAASMAVVEPSGNTNQGLHVLNNIFDRLAVRATTALTYVGHNCIREGGRGEKLVTADPRFSDTTIYFTLARNSPCRDAGMYRFEWHTPATDFGGIRRDARPDNGAREVA